MNKKLGFIGAGKMANSIMNGIFNSKLFNNFSFFDVNKQTVDEIKQKYNAIFYNSIQELVKNNDIILICIKPFIINEVLEEIKKEINSEKLIISIAAGVSSQKIETALSNNAKVIRVMPNTPALINEGISGLCKGNFANDDDLDLAKKIMQSVGETVIVEEDKIDIVTALSGSGPAFYYYIINELAKSAQNLGLDYETALKLSSQTAIGAGKMILNGLKNNINVEKLIENVTTKGGCTEVGNNVLLNSNISDILNKTIIETMDKAKKLG
ncbi:MAG: pyrroline-5-carboxylate reductase [Clostridiales bacterium 36_14]|nr:MAG: pyrroline-5-carboxylate reductase [Clostridiales bacterium 36_14]